MKTLYAFFLFAMISCSQYGVEPAAQHELATVQTQPLSLVSHTSGSLENGLFQASIGSQQVQVLVENGEMKWMVPALEGGDYTLVLEQKGLLYAVELRVSQQSEILSPASAIGQMNEELGLGFDLVALEELSAEQQQAFAQFLMANKEHIRADKSRAKKQRNQRTSSVYNSLNVGESVTFDVASAEYWNGSGVFATAGQAFEVTATGTWKDWYINTDANGYNSWQLALFTLLRRAKSEPWFKLIASANQSCNYPVGKSAIIRPQTGPLDFYANDADGFYWNNYGSITVTVTRVE